MQESSHSRSFESKKTCAAVRAPWPHAIARAATPLTFQTPTATHIQTPTVRAAIPAAAAPPPPPPPPSHSNTATHPSHPSQQRVGGRPAVNQPGERRLVFECELNVSGGTLLSALINSWTPAILLKLVLLCAHKQLDSSNSFPANFRVKTGSPEVIVYFLCAPIEWGADI